MIYSNTKPPQGALINFSHVLSKDLAAFWVFNERMGNKVLDLSNNGWTCTINGISNTTTNGWNPGKFGTSVYLVGVGAPIYNYGIVGDMGAFFSPGSVEYWMQPFAIENYRNSFSTNTTGAKNRGIRFEENSSGNFVVVFGNNSGTYTSHTYLASGLAAYSWYHVVLTWNQDASNVKGYLNGVQKFNEAHSYWPTVFDATFIGGGYDSSRSWKGIIDCVRMYKRELTQGEVTQLYA